MSDGPEKPKPPQKSSRLRHRDFVRDYRDGRLDAADEKKTDAIDKTTNAGADEGATGPRRLLRGKRKEYAREYLRWIWPHRFAVAAFFIVALTVAGLQMVEPLFMRFMIDRVLLNTRLDAAARWRQLNLAGALLLGLIVASNLFNAFKEYRQRLLNTRVMLSLRRSLFERLLHLPLAIVSPSISIIRLVIAVIVLTSLNWRLALTALAIIPGVMLISFIAAKR